MPVDSYRFIPRSMRSTYEGTKPIDEPDVWAPLSKPVEACPFALLTSAGAYLKDSQEPFDTEREKREPRWGDPTYRVIPADVRQEQVGHAHLHINGDDILEDLNIALPIRAFKALAEAGEIGGLADAHYSFMGFQAPGLEDWRNRQGPELARRLHERSVDVLMLAPA